MDTTDTTDTTNPITTLFARFSQRDAERATGIPRSTLKRLATADTLPSDVAEKVRAALASDAPHDAPQSSDDEHEAPVQPGAINATRESTLYVALDAARAEHSAATTQLAAAKHDAHYANIEHGRAYSDQRDIERKMQFTGSAQDKAFEERRLAEQAIEFARCAEVARRATEVLDAATTRAASATAALQTAERDYRAELDSLCPVALVRVDRAEIDTAPLATAVATATETLASADATVVTRGARLDAERATLANARDALSTAQDAANDDPSPERINVAIAARERVQHAEHTMAIVTGAHDVAVRTAHATKHRVAATRADLLMASEGAVDPATESAVRVATALLDRANQALTAENERAARIASQCRAIRGN